MMLRLFILVLLCHFSLGDYIEEKIYMSVKESGFSFCFRRLNATNAIGCTSKIGGNVGSVYLMINETNVAGLSSAEAPYIIVMSMKHFANSSLLYELNNNSMVTGIVVVEPESKEDLPTSFSSDDTCPNAARSMYGPDKQCATTWNPSGTKYFFQNWNFPIVLLYNTQVEELNRIISCYQKHNVERPDDRRCAMQLKTEMSGVHDSKTCVRRSFYDGVLISLSQSCDLMKGNNMYVAHTPPASISKNVILVITRLDALSLFHKKSFGSFAVSPAVGVVLTLMKAFAEVTTVPNKQLIFSFLYAESMDYRGSFRLTYDMQKGVYLKSLLGHSINFTDIESVIEVSQLGSGAEAGKFFVHTSQTSKKSALDSTWVNDLKSNMKESMIEQKKDPVLPPSSVQSIFKFYDDFSYILLTDHKEKYENKYFHSLLDDATDINIDNLYNLANGLYKALHKALYTKTNGNLNKEDFTRTVNCFYNVSKCTIIEEALPMTTRFSDSGRMKTLLDTSYGAGVSEFATVVEYLTFYMSGRAVDSVEKGSNCKAFNDSAPVYTYKWIAGPNGTNSTGVCWRSLTLYQGIQLLGIDDAWKDFNTTEYPYWTESVWTVPTVRLFLKPSRLWEAIVLSVGVGITLISMLCMFLILKYFDNLFPSASYFAGSNMTP